MISSHFYIISNWAKVFAKAGWKLRRIQWWWWVGVGKGWQEVGVGKVVLGTVYPNSLTQVQPLI